MVRIFLTHFQPGSITHGGSVVAVISATDVSGVNVLNWEYDVSATIVDAAPLAAGVRTQEGGSRTGCESPPCSHP